MSSIRRSVRVMELLARDCPLGVRAIASELRLPLGSVHRLLLDLEKEGIVERTPAGEWELSFRLLEITGLQLERIHFPSLARPFAERIAAATSEIVNISVLSGLNAVCVDKVRGNDGMQLDLPIGSQGMLYCGGASKAILAFLREDDRRRVIEGPLTPRTSHTITDAEALAVEIDRIRKRGYSIDDQEVVLSVYCVAVPIVDRNGYSVGAISITGTSPKSPGPEVQPLVDMLNAACGYVSRRLGYLGGYPLNDTTRERLAEAS